MRQDDANGARPNPAAAAPGPFVGTDGFAMLALSCLVLLAGAGLTLLTALLHVVRVAVTAPATAGGAARILVPGYRLTARERPAPLYCQRLDRARALLAAMPGATVFLLGGRTRPALRSEAEIGAAWLRARGVPAGRLRCEDGSRHTLENLRHYRAAFPAGGAAPVLLVSNRFHLARAALMARGLGLACVPCAAEGSPAAALRRPGRLLAEAFLVHWYVVGRSFSRWTGNARMLARIS